MAKKKWKATSYSWVCQSFCSSDGRVSKIRSDIIYSTPAPSQLSIQIQIEQSSESNNEKENHFNLKSLLWILISTQKSKYILLDVFLNAKKMEKNWITNKTSFRIIRIINSTLKEILINSTHIVVSLNLASDIMAIYSKGADMLAHLLYGFQRLQHLSPFVYNMLPYCHWFSWRHRAISWRHWPRCLIARSHGIMHKSRGFFLMSTELLIAEMADLVAYVFRVRRNRWWEYRGGRRTWMLSEIPRSIRKFCLIS